VVSTIISHELSNNANKKIVAKQKLQGLKDDRGYSLDISVYGAGDLANPSDEALVEFLTREAFGQAHQFAQQAPTPQPTPRQDTPPTTPTRK
jgi:hypothetical protein